MANSRRNFIKKTGMTGAGLLGAGIMAGNSRTDSEEPFPQTHRQTFNMSGYAAPPLDVVRIGVIGLGDRGTGTVRGFSSIEGVEIKALCDLEPERVEKSLENIRHLGHTPDLYSGHEDEWKKVCERPDIDLIIVVTPWHLHTLMCVFAMEHDKHVCTELPAATTIDECWQLVETSERTKKHCVQMSVNCQSGLAAVNLNMARQGFFGDIIHGEGAYIHQLINEIYFFHSAGKFHNMWRLKENIGKHGNLYPQHGLVPLIQMMDVNCGDKMDYLTSVSSNDFSLGEAVKRFAEKDDIWKQFAGKEFRGNMNITIIRTVKGRTIVMQHDISSPRPYSRIHLISGTKAIVRQYPLPARIATSHRGWVSEEEFNSLIEKYTPEITKKFNELNKQAENYQRSGTSIYSATGWRLIDCLRNGLPMDMDVYEAAASSSVIPLSIWSVANRSNSVTVPDFTSGKWETNQRSLDIKLLKGGGNTGLK